MASEEVGKLRAAKSESRVLSNRVANMQGGPTARFWKCSVPSYCSIETHAGDHENGLAMPGVEPGVLDLRTKNFSAISVERGGGRGTGI